MAQPAEPLPNFDGRFQSLEGFARGGMADIFRAFDNRAQREVVVKCQRELADNAVTRRFELEIKVLGAVVHPFVLPILDAGRLPDGRGWLATPLLDQRCVRYHREKVRPLTIDEVLQLGSDICEALSAVHDHGWLHRDVKPANILLSGGHFVLADFGVATRRTEEPFAAPSAGLDTDAPSASDRSQRITELGASVGTPMYMSLDRMLGADATTADDCFALLCVLYEELTNSDPFPRRDGDTLFGPVSRGAPDPRDVAPHLPPALARLLTTGLAPVVADRFQTARELRSALLAVAS